MPRIVSPQSFIKGNTICIYDHFRFTNQELVALHQDNQFNFFQRLQQEYHVFEMIENMTIETDGCFGFENDILKQFTKLKYLHISGSRWWNLQMNQFPDSIESLQLTDSANLSLKKLWNGIETMVNLKTLYLDIWDLMDPETLKIFLVEKVWEKPMDIQNQIIPEKCIVIWPVHLKTLILNYETNFHQYPEFENDEEYFLFRDHHERIVDYPIFKNIKSKIIKTEFQEHYLGNGEMLPQSIIFFQD